MPTKRNAGASGSAAGGAGGASCATCGARKLRLFALSGAGCGQLSAQQSRAATTSGAFDCRCASAQQSIMPIGADMLHSCAPVCSGAPAANVPPSVQMSARALSRRHIAGQDNPPHTCEASLVPSAVKFIMQRSMQPRAQATAQTRSPTRSTGLSQAYLAADDFRQARAAGEEAHAIRAADHGTNISTRPSSSWARSPQRLKMCRRLRRVPARRRATRRHARRALHAPVLLGPVYYLGRLALIKRGGRCIVSLGREQFG